jgi:mannose-6-phosphate isomerase-like protein (cupin superfamily)
LNPQPFPQAPLHVHDRGEEGFIVLSGALDVTVGSEIRRLAPGEFVVVPAGTAHTFATVEDQPASILVTMTPEIDALVRELHQVPDEERGMVWTRYDSRKL